MGELKKVSSKDIIIDYLTHSTIHGCRYVIHNRLNLLEKILWAILIFSCYIFGKNLVQTAFEVESAQQTNISLYFGTIDNAHCTKCVLQTNIPRIRMVYIFRTGMNSTYFHMIWSMPNKSISALPIT